MQKHTIAVLVDNSAGVLVRIAGLISRRGFNIDSLAVGETQHPDLSRITLIVPCDQRILYQVVEQLRKQQCVKAVEVLTPGACVARELILVKVKANVTQRSEIMQIASVFRARVLDVGRESITLELTGETNKTEALIGLMNDYGILEMARTGVVALERGTANIFDQTKEE